MVPKLESLTNLYDITLHYPLRIVTAYPMLNISFEFTSRIYFFEAFRLRITTVECFKIIANGFFSENSLSYKY